MVDIDISMEINTSARCIGYTLLTDIDNNYYTLYRRGREWEREWDVDEYANGEMYGYTNILHSDKDGFCLFVLYAFLNGWTDCDEIWYRDILDLRPEDRLR